MNPLASGFAYIQSAQPALPRAHRIAVECDIVKGLHAFTLVGLPDKAVEEAKDRISAAIKNCGFESPKKSNKKIVLSLAPADIKKEGSLFDVPLAIAFLAASAQIKAPPERTLYAGELGLDGTVRPIHGAISIAALARDEGFDTVIVPRENADEAALIRDIRIYGVTHLREIVALLENPAGEPHRRSAHASDADGDALDAIRGHEHAKRALIVAAAGGHNIALYGPPGTGKTLLARAAAALLPPLQDDEMVEVTTIHSLSQRIDGAIRRPPFRSPHHTASYASLIGGGSGTARPGEVTLAHRGVLFLDEFPEFRRDVIQALREPLEDGTVSIARARHSATYPAEFMLIAALNPCPCGFAGSPRCECMPHVIEKYRRKIQGPIADRIDIWVSVDATPLSALSVHTKRSAGETAAARVRIERARAIQRQRFAHTKTRCNAGMSAADIEIHAALSRAAERQLVEAAQKLRLSPRGYHRTVKLARTIADLAENETIEPSHMLEALQYRSRTLSS